MTTIYIDAGVYPCDECDYQQPDHDCHCWSCCGPANLIRAGVNNATGDELARLDVGYPDDDALELARREARAARRASQG